MRCYHVWDEVRHVKVFIPYCWDAVIHGAENCTCFEEKRPVKTR